LYREFVRSLLLDANGNIANGRVIGHEGLLRHWRRTSPSGDPRAVRVPSLTSCGVPRARWASDLTAAFVEPINLPTGRQSPFPLCFQM